MSDDLDKLLYSELDCLPNADQVLESETEVPQDEFIEDHPAVDYKVWLKFQNILFSILSIFQALLFIIHITSMRP